ncbi:MAG: hypothetical protein WAM14_02560 [Candidatus Nitrosopolaris sp.]
MKTWGFVTQDEENEFWTMFYRGSDPEKRTLVGVISSMISKRVDKKVTAKEDVYEIVEAL